MVCVLPNACTWLGPPSPMLQLCCTCVLQCGFCVTPVRLPPGRPSRPEGSREIDIGQRSLMRPPTQPRAARHKMEAVADPAGPGLEARDQQQLPRKSESQRQPGVENGGWTQVGRTSKAPLNSVVAQMISLSQAASLVKEWAPSCPQSSRDPRG
ncbi:hypothetical protein NDU88_007279 [Pleurodeles waltl]|uniref:Uncharacterized protein n=1 Tax=Pleurodeles waltl TaxID=8319 RepID=A0AAV7UQ72_PLEWA|nr:hypothetical protein NDU88_007279 [Pleurodeles waltl]